MKKLFAILISAILVVSAIVGITSCGNGDDDGTGSSAGSSDDGSYSSTGSNGNSDENINETKYNQAFALIDEGNCTREAYILGEEVYYNYRNYYDENGRVERIESYVDGYVYTFTYNEDGNRTAERGEASDGTYYTIALTYTENGELAKEVYTSGDNVETIDYAYNTEGYRTKMVLTLSNGYRETTVWEYDENGNASKEEFTSTDGGYECVETQYTFVYLTIDVPAATLSQLKVIYTIR